MELLLFVGKGRFRNNDWRTSPAMATRLRFKTVLTFLGFWHASTVPPIPGAASRNRRLLAKKEFSKVIELVLAHTATTKIGFDSTVNLIQRGNCHGQSGP